MSPRSRLAILAAILLGGVILPFVLFSARMEAAAAEWIGNGGGHVASALLVVTLLAADIVLPVPSSIVATAAGAMLGFAGGAAAVFVGLTLSSGIGFYAGRRWGPAIVRGFAGSEAQVRVQAWVARHGVVATAMTRAVPVLAETVAVVAGAGRLRPAPFFAATACANLGLAIVYAAAGAFSAAEANGTVAIAASLAVPLLAWVATRPAVRANRGPTR